MEPGRIEYRKMEEFYRVALKDLLARGEVALEDEILVVCGGEADRECLLEFGFKKVTISNLDVRMKERGEDVFEPYSWDFQDLENLSYPDDHFDFVIVHSGLHHLRSPHRGLLEMYRVARRGILGYEPHDSGFTRLGARLGFGQVYEDVAVLANDCEFGGVANTPVPNYVYRFSAGEIADVIQTAHPVAEHERHFWYWTHIPGRLKQLRSGLRYWVMKPVSGLLILLGRRVPFFANYIAFHVRKPELPKDLFPWLMMAGSDVTIDREWLAQKYRSGSIEEASE